MNHPEKPRPTLLPEAAAAQAERQAREAAALRENLRRRKAQARARDDAPATPKNSPPSQG
ncbi:MAG TPA: hypothetical protein VGC34_17325 [Steroidobacteraceae bacterium]